MNARSTREVVQFVSPFYLPGFDKTQPPGEYLVTFDEEPIEAGSDLAWRRVRTFMYLPAISASSLTQQMVPISPSALQAALEKDERLIGTRPLCRTTIRPEVDGTQRVPRNVIATGAFTMLTSRSSRDRSGLK